MLTWWEIGRLSDIGRRYAKVIVGKIERDMGEWEGYVDRDDEGEEERIREMGEWEGHVDRDDEWEEERYGEEKRDGGVRRTCR